MYVDTIDGTKGDLEMNRRMMMIFKPKSANILSENTQIKLNFALSGVNYLSYTEPSELNIKIVANTNFLLKPIAAVPLIVQTDNILTV